jgi:hypothetical protein
MEVKVKVDKCSGCRGLRLAAVSAATVAVGGLLVYYYKKKQVPVPEKLEKT